MGNRHDFRQHDPIGLRLDRDACRRRTRIEGLQHAISGANAEFQFGEQVIESRGVNGSERQIVKSHIKFEISHQRVHGTIQLDLFDVLTQGFALFARDFVGMLDDLVKPAILVDPFRGEPVTHARHSRDIVGGFTA